MPAPQRRGQRVARIRDYPWLHSELWDIHEPLCQNKQANQDVAVGG